VARLRAFGVFTREPRTFTADEVNFLRASRASRMRCAASPRSIELDRTFAIGERRRIARALHDERCRS
jgi:hypothetical protein